MDSSKQKQSNSKRLDLQGIRALAIIVVLGFHFFPGYCPNGYLGVDQFFVLSGFLMCMLLKRAESQKFYKLIYDFYTRRFKRILPLYLLVILVSMICLYSFFPDTAIETNQESAIHALLFVSNRPKTDQENYFQQLSMAEDIFTHTWSLSAEVQFYFLVPFIFLLATRVPEKFQWGYYGLLAVASIIFSYTSSYNTSFNNVFSRIWQFLIGIIVYLHGTRNSYPNRVQIGFDENGIGESTKLKAKNESTTSKTISYILLLFMVVIVVFPIEIPAVYSRPTVTIGTGLLMLISEDNLILSNRVLTYTGDISYSLYLIHWPIYAYWKLTGHGNTYYLLLALFSSIILANVTFELFEKWYLKLSKPRVALLIVMLFLTNLLVIYKNDISDQIRFVFMKVPLTDKVTENMTIDDAEAMNYRWNINDHKNLFVPSCDYEGVNTPYGWCRHTGLSKQGKYKIMTIGNSWTANHGKMFYEECGYVAKSILQGSAYACEPLYLSSPSSNCAGNFSTFERRIAEEKPDYVFHITRFIAVGEDFPTNTTNIQEDPTYQIMKNQMLKLIENIREKMYIVNAIPPVNGGAIAKITSMLRRGIDREEIEKMLLDPAGYENARKRYEQLVKDCQGKCELIDYLPEFYSNRTKTFQYFDDKGFSHWTLYLHFSPYGIEKIRHIWTDLCAKL